MNTRNLLSTVLVLVAAVGVALSAQTQTQTRDTRAAAAAPTAPKGNAELSVLVTTDQDPSQPLRRAAVAIRNGELDVPHIGMTGEDGRVVFKDLAAGNYLLTAERAGYVKTFYGSPQPGRGPGVAVTLVDGQRVSDIQIKLLRGGVITGTLRNTSGRPAPSQAVRAIMVQTVGGARRALSNDENMLGRSVVTDDRGVYRIFGLPPGDYIVSVAIGAFGVDQMRQVTLEELQWADRAVSTAGTNLTAPPNLAAAPAPKQPVAYSPLYYPGTAVPSEASLVTLGPNEERAGVDFSLTLVPTATLSGRVVDAEGRPQAGVSISVKPQQADYLDLFSSLLNKQGSSRPDGTFEISGVKPGAYTLAVRATPKTGNEPASANSDRDAAMAMVGAMLGGGGPGTTHWAAENISVQGADIGGLNLVLRPGMTMTGKIVYEATTKTAPTDMSKGTALSLMPAPTGTGIAELANLFSGGANGAKISADGAFTISGVAPGRYRLNNPLSMVPMPMMAGLTGGWTLKSVMANGRDIADAPIDMKAGTDVANVVVTFTDHPSELSGSVMDAAGRVTPGFPIVVFSTDKAYWTLASRRVQIARPSSDGKYKITGLPAGEYYVCAVTAVDRSEQYDPAFLEQLTPVAIKITMADGEKKVHNLKLGGADPNNK